MRHLFSFLGLTLALLAGQAHADLRRVRVVAPCPKTYDAWVKRREDFLNAFGVLTSKSFDQIGRWAQEKLQDLESCRRETPEIFAKNPGLDQCWAPVMDWLKALKPFRSVRTGLLYVGEDREKIDAEPPQKLGMNVPDAEYYRRTSQYTEIPADVRGSQSLLRSLLEPKNLPGTYAELEKLNVVRRQNKQPEIQYAVFKGNVPASGNASKMRLMLYIPGNPAQWFSLGLPTDDGQLSPQWSAVGVVKHQDGKTDVYFKDHWRRYEKANEKDTHYGTTFEDVKEGKFTDACWKCHKSGLIALPVDPTMTERDRNQTIAFNKAIAETGLSGSGGFYQPEKLGPGLGGTPDEESGLAELREKIFPYCVADAVEYNAEAKAYTKKDYDALLGQIDKKKLLHAMNCSSCHDGVQRGRLTVPFGDILNRYIEEHRMPMGTKLNDVEAKVLKICLQKEFSGIAGQAERNRLSALEDGTEVSGPVGNYLGIEGLPEVTGLTPGRLTRQLTRVACTPEGRREPAPAPRVIEQPNHAAKPQSKR